MSFRDVLLRGTIDDIAYQPYLVMASRLNFTLELKTTEEYRTFNEINNLAIFLHRFVRAASYDWVSAHAVVFFEGFRYDLLLHGADVRRLNVLALESILIPFSWSVWE